MSRARSGCQVCNEFCHILCGALAVAFDGRDQCTADDSCIREFPYSGKLLWSRNSKSHRDRQFREPAQALDEFARVIGKLLSRSGDSGARNRVNESSRNIGNCAQPLVGAGRRD